MDLKTSVIEMSNNCWVRSREGVRFLMDKDLDQIWKSRSLRITHFVYQSVSIVKEVNEPFKVWGEFCTLCKYTRATLEIVRHQAVGNRCDTLLTGY